LVISLKIWGLVGESQGLAAGREREAEAAFGGMKSRVRISLLRRDLLLDQSAQKEAKTAF
jgi:hypothetical protein